MKQNNSLNALRESLKSLEVDAFCVPTNDAFLSEYTPDSAKKLAWLTGFDGSAGLALVLREPVEGKIGALFTDGRYTLQAAQQVDGAHYHIIDSAKQSAASWLQAQRPEAVLGFDAWLHTQTQLRRWHPLGHKALSENPLDALWHERPIDDAKAAFLHPFEYAGETSESKRQRVISAMDPAADAVLLSLPDGINWLLNIRGSDIPFNPLVLCYALLKRNGDMLIISAPRSWPELEQVTHLDMDEFRLSPAGVFSDIKAVQMDPSATVHGLWSAAEHAGCQIIEAADPTLLPKAIKNVTEIDGMRAAHKRDGRALSRFLNWCAEQSTYSELQAADQLEKYRQEEAGDAYRGPSFETISGSGPNGAIVHYRVTAQSNRSIEQGELYLVDSGAQYPDGTTDVTRTIAHGAPSEEMIDRFTRVLKGHIALAMAIFPEGTSGSQLDSLARQHLWEIGEDYAHGTGHGVGSYLCVHEGPQRISKRGGDVALQAGMILSNEPGYYKPDAYGIRIENLVLVVPAKQKGFLAFETLTLAPIDAQLVDRKSLTAQEVNWLDAYHARVEANNT